MTAFQQFRLWARRAPVAQRLAAGVGAALVVAMLAWLLVPAGADSDPGTDLFAGASGGQGDGSGSDGDEALDAGTSDTVPITGSGAGGGGGQASGAGPAGTGASSTSGPCQSPPGSDQGVTDDEIKIAVILIELLGSQANGLVGVPPVEEQRSDYQVIIDDLNANGGVACRKLVARYYVANPIDQTSLQRVCLDIAEERVFYVIDSGTYFLFPSLASCYAQRQIPIFSPGLLPEQVQRQAFPYFFGGGLQEVVHRNMILALGQRGWFGAGNGFQKLGLLYRSCNQQLPPLLVKWANQAGVPSSQIVRHDFGCPPANASPAEVQQAVLTFQQEGVTHVATIEDEIDFASFTSAAEQQRYRPKYAVTATLISQTYAQQHADYNNIADAVAIPQTRHAEERTPGYKPTAGTLRCDAILAKHGKTPVYKHPTSLTGNDCSALWMFQAAVQHAPRVERRAIAAGLQAAGSVEMAYPIGPTDFRRSGTTYLGQFWRAAQFFRDCNCWRLIDPEFHPSFP